MGGGLQTAVSSEATLPLADLELVVWGLFSLISPLPIKSLVVRGGRAPNLDDTWV